MGSYILNFTVYTMAMCGLICFALFVYKKFAIGGFSSKKSQFLNVEETLSLAPRKTLYVVRAGEERFLIASDSDKTSLISKLGENTNINSQIIHAQQTVHAQRPVNSAVSVDFETQLKHARQAEERIKSEQTAEHIQQLYPQRANNNVQQKSNIEYSGKTTLIEVEDFPEIKTNKKRARKSNDILKSMVERVKG